MTQVKYLGVPICIDPKAQKDQCITSIKRNLGLMKWKLRKVDIEIKETLTCVLARSILIYIGTPMVPLASGRGRTLTGPRPSSTGASTISPMSSPTGPS